MLLASIAGLASESVERIAGVLAWAAGLTLLRGLRRRQLVVVALLAGFGTIGIAVSALRGDSPDWALVLSGNQLLISLLVAVSFLRLVVAPGPPAEEVDHPPSLRKPRGRAAVWQTMAGVHLLGAVINISVVEMVGERILSPGAARRGPILLLSRAYSTGAFWSPFWGATAAALTYAPHARLTVLVAVGGLTATLALVSSTFTVTRALGDDLATFRGFPFTADALAVPLMLVVAVLGSHLLLPGVPVSGVISICSLVLTVLLLLHRRPKRVLRDLNSHAVLRLPEMRTELTLFLAAGMLAAGVTAVLHTFGPWVPFDTFTVVQAYVVLLVMVAASMAGVHPVITIAVAAALLQPVHPDPTLFAMTGLLAWGIQAAGGPLSGLNVVMHSRFGIDSFTIARWNVKYVAGVLLLATLLLPLCRFLSARAA
jgi:hypothetical protein